MLTLDLPFVSTKSRLAALLIAATVALVGCGEQAQPTTDGSADPGTQTPATESANPSAAMLEQARDVGAAAMARAGTEVAAITDELQDAATTAAKDEAAEMAAEAEQQAREAAAKATEEAERQARAAADAAKQSADDMMGALPDAPR